MAIRIERNDQGNCINFYGSSNPTYWNACLSGEVDATDSTLVNVKNDIKTAEAGTAQYEFFQIPFTEFLDEDNNAFANAQEVADYITLKGNVTIGTGVTYKGIWDADTNTPDITTDVSGFNAGDFYKIIAPGTHDLGSGDVDFINGDEVIFDATNWERKPFAGALIEYDSTAILLNNNAAVYADGAQGLEEPNGAEDGWYFINDEAGKKINWYFLGNENTSYEITKATLQGGYVRLKVLTPMGTDSPFISLYTTPQGDGFDAFWFRSRYTYTGDFTGISVNQEVIAYWGDEPSVSPELTRVQLTLNAGSTLLSTAPDISNDPIYTMSLGTNSAATVDSIEFIAKELGYKNQQYLRSYLLEAKLENIVVPQNDNDLTDTVVDFKLDATSTSIMLDNGYAYGVNTIKAIDTGDGLITIKSIQGDLTHWVKLDHTNVTIGEDSVSGGLNDVINTLNELFTVGAFEAVVIADPYSTLVADVAGVTTTEAGGAQGTAIETGTDEYGATTSGYNAAGYKTPETINQAGEYFTFDIRNEGIIGFGLIPSQADYDNGDYNGNSTYADPSTFCNGPNSGHYGYQFSHWFHPSPDGPWTNYGANTSYSMREGWTSSSKAFRYSDEGADWIAGNPTKIKVGIDANNFISIEYYDASEGLFIPIARTSYPVPNGNEYHLGIKFGDTTVRMVGIPKIHLLEEQAPTMNFRYAESPDGVFKFPLFATEEEAEYYDTVKGGSGTYTTLMLPDDPTNTLWHIPDTEYTGNGIFAPVGVTFEGVLVNYTEITTLINADLLPPAFTAATVTVNELSSFNYQTQPQDTGYGTSFLNLPVGLVDAGGGIINGTAPEVTGDNVTNPTDSYDITVVRTNSKGSTTGTLTIVVTNLTAPVITAITGFTHNASSTALSDEDTMNDGSVVTMDEDVKDLERLVILKSFVETNVLPSLQQAGDKYYMGVLNSGADVSSIEDADWDIAFVWEYQTATTHNYRVIKDGTQQHSVGIGSNTVALFDYAIEAHDGHVYMIACNANAINTEPSPEFGGTFTNATKVTLSESYPLTISLAYVGSATATFSETDLSEIVTPIPDNWIQVTASPSHTLNFDGSTTMPTLQAGYTYRFMMGDTIYADLSTSTGLHPDDDLRFTADGSTEYTTGITRVGNPNDTDTFGAHTAYVEFVVPSDVPPLQWYTDHNGIGSATGINISGSTYVTPITGITQEGPAANQTGSNIMDAGDHGWISIDEQLSAGERLVLDNAFFADFLGETQGTNNIFAIGLKGDNWTNTKEVNNQQAATSGEFFKGNTYLVGVWSSGASSVTMTLISNGSVGNSMLMNSSSLFGTACAFLEITTSGNNIRAAFGRNNSTGNITAGDESTVTYADWNAYKGETGDQGYGISSIDVVMSFWTFNGGAIDGNNIDWTGLSEINIPTAAVTTLTNWSKALDFSGSAERAQQVSSDSNRIPMKMGGTNNQVLAPTSGNTVASGHPWATVIVFNAEVYNSNQHIWNLGEGAGTTDDNIYLRRSTDRKLYFGWGRSGDVSECEIIDISSNMSTWHAIYIAHNGTRYGSNNTTSLMADAFDIRHARASASWVLSSNLSTTSNWTITGDGRMNRQFQGDMTIGGRGANRNFHGKVASFVSTTLRVGVAMPTTTEIQTMITDPIKWLNDYKVGVNFRLPWQTTDAGFNFSLNDGSSSYSTQVWLMGDGNLDSYSNMIRNQVNPSDQNYTKLNLISMVSNDIENVNIPGLT